MADDDVTVVVADERTVVSGGAGTAVCLVVRAVVREDSAIVVPDGTATEWDVATSVVADDDDETFVANGAGAA